jgi:pSer/pThr/pTyr-binding forkhead associated (FHA) protein/pimeloyl-ACP methyl ester carboxylesterase
MASLTVTSGKLADTTVEIAGELTIGRADADLTLGHDAKVSRRHAVVHRRGAVLEIEDLGSANGTFVDGRRIKGPTLIGDGTRLRIGRTELVVENKEDAVTKESSRRVDPLSTRLGGEPLDPEMTVERPAGAAPGTPAGRSGDVADRERAAAPPLDTPGGPGAPPPLDTPGGPGAPPPLGTPGSPGAPPPSVARRFRVPIGLGLLAIVLAVVLIAVLGSSSTSKPTPPGAIISRTLVDVPVRFTVVDEDRSLLKCAATGRKLAIAGELVTPAAPTSSITVYLHGVTFSGDFEFHNDLVPGYDFARDMVKQGQASLIVDRVGYGRTVPYPPNGLAYCGGAEADIAHQIVSDLRDGTYKVGAPGVVPTAYTHVVVAGYSIGGLIAELEAGSFHDVDGLILLSWADGFNPFGTSLRYVIGSCKKGLPKPPGGLFGYFNALPTANLTSLLSSQADPRILAALKSHAELDPCGEALGVQRFAALSSVIRAAVRVPVLIVYGERDRLFPPTAWQLQERAFTGATDHTLVPIPDGDLLMLDRHAALTRHAIAGWLQKHGF